MTLKYLLKGLPFIVLIILLSSCLGKGGSSQNDLELSQDARIYNFSLTSSKDTTKALPKSPFTIDQLGDKIFNRDSLPYLFHVDSVKMNLTGLTSAHLSKIVIKLVNPDSTYTWNTRDSIALSRLSEIETTAADKKTTKKYLFTLNVHQQDPYILKWTHMAQNYLTPTPVNAQKTFSLNGKFFTYFKAGRSVMAMSSSNTDGSNWVAENTTGLPSDVDLKTIIAVNIGSTDVVYAMNVSQTLYKSTDGIHWDSLPTTYPIVSIYGKLPSADGEFSILTVVNNEGALRFAKTTDFSSFTLFNRIPTGIPTCDFSNLSLETANVYTAKYIILSGGKAIDNAINDKIWLLQQNRDEIKKIEIPNHDTIPIQQGTIFWYDEKLYLFSGKEKEGVYKNKLYFSANYGINWTKAGENQALPAENFPYRENATVITDNQNFIWIFGGIFETQQIVDVWRGRLNKLATN